MSANIEQIKAMLERTGKTNLLQKPKVDLDKERFQLEAMESRNKTLEQVAEVMTREKLLTILQDASRVIYMAESWAYSNSKLAELCKARKQLKEVILHLNNGGKI